MNEDYLVNLKLPGITFLPLQRPSQMGEMVFVQLAQAETGSSSYQVAIFELHKLLGALVFVHRVVVGDNALAIDGSLELC